jgi:hypothetical protein
MAALAMGNGGAMGGGTANLMGKAAVMGGNTIWAAAVIKMDSGSKIAMDCGSGH